MCRAFPCFQAFNYRPWRPWGVSARDKVANLVEFNTTRVRVHPLPTTTTTSSNIMPHLILCAMHTHTSRTRRRRANICTSITRAAAAAAAACLPIIRKRRRRRRRRLLQTRRGREWRACARVRVFAAGIHLHLIAFFRVAQSRHQTYTQITSHQTSTFVESIHTRKKKKKCHDTHTHDTTRQLHCNCQTRQRRVLSAWPTRTRSRRDAVRCSAVHVKPSTHARLVCQPPCVTCIHAPHPNSFKLCASRTPEIVSIRIDAHNTRAQSNSARGVLGGRKWWGVGGRPSKSRYIWWVRAFQSQTPVNTCVSSDARLSRLGGSFCRGRFLLGSVFESAFNQMAPSEHIPVLAQQPTSTQTPKHTHKKKTVRAYKTQPGPNNPRRPSI